MSFTVTPCFKTDGVYRGIDFRLADNRCNHFTEIVTLSQVDRFKPHRFCVRKPRRVEVTDEYDSCTEYLCQRCAARPTGPAPATYTVEPTPTPAVTAP